MRPYRAAPRQNEKLRREIKRMLQQNIIKEAESDYTSPMILVKPRDETMAPA